MKKFLLFLLCVFAVPCFGMSGSGALTDFSQLVKSMSELDMVQFVQSGAASPHARVSDAQSLLQYAIVKRMDDLAFVLIMAGADLKQVDFSGKSLVMLAAEYGSTLLVKTLLDTDFSLRSRTDNGGLTIVHSAVIGGDSDCLLIILNAAPELVNKVDCFKIAPIDFLFMDETLFIQKMKMRAGEAFANAAWVRLQNSRAVLLGWLLIYGSEYDSNNRFIDEAIKRIARKYPILAALIRNNTERLVEVLSRIEVDATTQKFAKFICDARGLRDLYQYIENPELLKAQPNALSESQELEVEQPGQPTRMLESDVSHPQDEQNMGGLAPDEVRLSELIGQRNWQEAIAQVRGMTSFDAYSYLLLCIVQDEQLTQSQQTTFIEQFIDGFKAFKDLFCLEENQREVLHIFRDIINAPRKKHLFCLLVESMAEFAPQCVFDKLLLMVSSNAFYAPVVIPHASLPGLIYAIEELLFAVNPEAINKHHRFIAVDLLLRAIEKRANELDSFGRMDLYVKLGKTFNRKMGQLLVMACDSGDIQLIALLSRYTTDRELALNLVRSLIQSKEAEANFESDSKYMELRELYHLLSPNEDDAFVSQAPGFRDIFIGFSALYAARSALI